MISSFSLLSNWFGSILLSLSLVSPVRLLIKHAFDRTTKVTTRRLTRKQVISAQEFPKGNISKLQYIKAIEYQHETAHALSRMIEYDGAGEWPPATKYDSWPDPLGHYHDIYLEISPLLSTSDPLADDIVLTKHRHRYRNLMAKLLSERVDLAKVKSILTQAEAGDRYVISREIYNGFYCTVAVCRHAFRWAIIPVIKVAQNETVIEFPPELEVPWHYLQRHFGVSADSGNNTANVLHNFDRNGNRIYKINVNMSDSIRSTEETFFRMFYDLEVLAFPIYYEMIRAIISYEQKMEAACLSHLESISVRVRHLLKLFYDNMVESRIHKSAWLSYVQGFQGWGVGRTIGKEFVKFDGLSGNHVLFFQALDAFLGMDRYLTDQNMILYIPTNQRSFCRALKEHSFRRAVSEGEDVPLKEEMQKIVNHLKVFRSAHRARVMPYLRFPAPERLTMTAGKSVLETPDTKDINEALKALDDMLVVRLGQTI